MYSKMRLFQQNEYMLFLIWCFLYAGRYCTGDISIDLMNHDSHNATTGYLSTMLYNEFMSTVLLPTRVTSITCTLIDHLFYHTKAFRDDFINQEIYSQI